MHAEILKSQYITIGNNKLPVHTKFIQINLISMGKLFLMLCARDRSFACPLQRELSSFNSKVSWPVQCKSMLKKKSNILFVRFTVLSKYIVTHTLSQVAPIRSLLQGYKATL